jgi:signal transduction histidine kinase
MKSLPSRLKIALLSAGLSGLVLIVFGVSAWYTVYQMRLDSVDREIRSLASRHPGIFAGRGNPDRLASAIQFAFGEDNTNRLILIVQETGGRILYQSPSWPAEIAPQDLGLSTTSAAINRMAGVPEPVTKTPRGQGFGLGRGGPPSAASFGGSVQFRNARSGTSNWRVGIISNERITLAVGLNQQEVLGEMIHLRDFLLVSIPVALVFIGLGGWIIAGRALHPLSLIADTAERVTAHGLGERIPDAAENPEAQRVIQILNRMMDRLEHSFQQASRFSSDASHELKTPIAVMQGELENALQAAAPGSPEQQLFASLLEQTERLRTITRNLLLLAQADAGRLSIVCHPIDLSKEIEGLVDDAEALATGRNLSFDVQISPGVMVEADRALLHAACFNLLTNAIKYNEPGGRVSVQLQSGSTPVVTIGNSGPGIPAEDQEKIFHRFYRVRQNPATEGMGLGLSLAREIIHAHGGELVLKESAPGWTVFQASLKQSARRATG